MLWRYFSVFNIKTCDINQVLVYIKPELGCEKALCTRVFKNQKVVYVTSKIGLFLC